MDINTFLMTGRPGSGKGTQAKLLADKIGASMFSTGEKFRSMASGNTFIGRRLKGAMESGELLPHWLASYTFETILLGLEPDDKIVFEGACRTAPEAALFEEIASWLPRGYKAVYLRISEEEAWKRLLLRSKESGRADDDEQSVRTRFNEYKKKNEAVIEHFRSVGRLVEINGEQTREEVHQDVLKALNLQ